MSSDCEFPGFGRVIERSETEELEVAASDVQAASKLLGLNSPTGHSHCSMSTGRNLTGRSEDETHAGVSADEAQMICKSVLSELLNETPAESAVQNVKALSLAQSTAVSAVPKIHFKAQSESSKTSLQEPVFGVDLARVKVIACETGCIMGMLEWCGAFADGSTERVIFSLLQIRPGYAVVGECSEGPKLLSSLCWKLQSTNGRLDVNVASIRRGDVLMLEGPRWATKRLMESTPASASSGVRQNSNDLESTDVLHDLAALADASSKLLAASEMDDEPPLLRPSAMPQLAFPSLSQRSPIESGRSFLKDSMRTPKEVGRGTTLMHSMRTPKESDRSELKDTRRSWELGSDINSAVRPFVPTLDFSAISQLRKQRLQNNWVPVTPKSSEDFPAMTPTLTQPSERKQNVCIDPSGCTLGFVECKMVAPGGPMSKAVPQGL